jgi:hypothetical protein
MVHEMRVLICECHCWDWEGNHALGGLLLAPQNQESVWILHIL